MIDYIKFYFTQRWKATINIFQYGEWHVFDFFINIINRTKNKTYIGGVNHRGFILIFEIFNIHILSINILYELETRNLDIWVLILNFGFRLNMKYKNIVECDEMSDEDYKDFVNKIK